jgi:hypothetical protein
MDKRFDKTPDEHIAEILSRWTVTDLREMDDDDLNRGLERYKMQTADIRTIRKGEMNFIKFWDITSKGREYQVRRFENFIWCSCLDFFYSKTVCKHCYATTNDFRRVQRMAMDSAKYLKQTSDYVPEKVGSVRI